MRVPTRKPGKYTHSKPDPHLTKGKFIELKDKVERMLEARPSLAREVKRLAADGDFSENAAYQMAKGKLRGLNQRVLDIQNHLKSAIIIARPKNKNIVQIGGTVIVEINGRKKSFTILGSTETNPAGGIISHKSPIGSAILNKKVGDIVKIKLKGKEVEYKIMEIGR